MNPDQRRAAGASDAETQHHLLASTQQLLGTVGAAALTSRTIAEAAQANLGSITYYFGSKDDLIAQAMLSLARELLEPVVEVLGSDRDAVSKLFDTVAVLNDTLADHHTEAATYVQVLAAASLGAPIADELRQLLDLIETLLSDQIDAQQRVGLLPPWITPPAMAQLIVALAHGTLTVSAVEPNRIDTTAISSQFAQLLLAASIPPDQCAP